MSKPLRTPDPVLVAARDEIHAILKKHDIAGCIVLSSRDAMEYLFEIEASWNCFKLEKIESGFTVRINNKDLPEGKKKEVLEATVGTVFGFADVFAVLQGNLNAIAQIIQEHVEVEHVTERIPDPEQQ